MVDDAIEELEAAEDSIADVEDAIEDAEYDVDGDSDIDDLVNVCINCTVNYYAGDTYVDGEGPNSNRKKKYVYHEEELSWFDA